MDNIPQKWGQDFEWTFGLPGAEGFYWFYGWTSRWDKGNPQVMLVQVVRTGNNHLTYITGGRFLYRAEGAYGIHRLATVPSPGIAIEHDLIWFREHDEAAK